MKKQPITNPEEVIGLIAQIVNGATGEDISASTLLRLCLRLSRELKNNELATWAQAELSGYDDWKSIPPYRILPGHVKGTFSGYGSMVKNASIPESFIDDEHAHLFKNYMTQPVSELQLLSSGSKTSPLTSNWSGDAIYYYQKKDLMDGYHLIEATRLISKPAVAGIIDNVRTRILVFVLQIQDELGLTSGSDAKTSKVTAPSSEKITQIFHQTITANNVAVGNIGATNQVNVMKGDFSSLSKALSHAGIDQGLISELAAALEADKNEEFKPGVATSRWIHKVSAMTSKGALALTANVTGSMISTMIMQYLGIG